MCSPPPTGPVAGFPPHRFAHRDLRPSYFGSLPVSDLRVRGAIFSCLQRPLVIGQLITPGEAHILHVECHRWDCRLASTVKAQTELAPFRPAAVMRPGVLLPAARQTELAPFTVAAEARPGVSETCSAQTELAPFRPATVMRPGVLPLAASQTALAPFTHHMEALPGPAP